MAQRVGHHVLDKKHTMRYSVRVKCVLLYLTFIVFNNISAVQNRSMIVCFMDSNLPAATFFNVPSPQPWDGWSHFRRWNSIKCIFVLGTQPQAPAKPNDAQIVYNSCTCYMICFDSSHFQPSKYHCASRGFLLGMLEILGNEPISNYWQFSKWNCVRDLDIWRQVDNKIVRMDSELLYKMGTLTPDFHLSIRFNAQLRAEMLIKLRPHIE